MQFSSKDVFNSINSIRGNPQIVSHAIKEQLNKFDSQTSYRNSQGTRVRTNSGKPAWQDAILSLQRQKPKSPLQWNDGLAASAEYYKTASQQNPDLNPYQVLPNFVEYEGAICIVSSATQLGVTMNELMASFIVSDADEQKTCRVAIFHPIYKQFGCSIDSNSKNIVIHLFFAERITKVNPNISKQHKQITQQKPTTVDYNNVEATHVPNVSNVSNISNKSIVFRSDMEEQKLVIKKTSRSRVQQIKGRMYKVTFIKLLYEDQTEEEIIEEELIR